ncbi:hypothetical protein ACIRJR_33260 [Streptomyces sp. NPDC102402]|uniref:hypothetical protein n=1 Tax=Streptomyces sp. NPDC102402 TaxID=3366169 RepID=UPI0038168F18
MQKFDTPAPIAAVFDVPTGRVQVIAATRTDTVVEILPMNPAKSRDVKVVERVVVEFDAGVLRVGVPTRHQRFGPSGAVEVTVRLPAGSRIEGRADATEFRGVGRFGEIDFEGAYRRVKIDEAGSVRLAVVDGSVEVGRLGGSAEISTGRGDIRIAEALGGVVVLRTQQGDISVGAARGVSASLDAGTTYGRVGNDLRNDGTATLDIHATTSKGDITARSL